MKEPSLNMRWLFYYSFPCHPERSEGSSASGKSPLYITYIHGEEDAYPPICGSSMTGVQKISVPAPVGIVSDRNLKSFG
jgi:hypothetical protein